MLFRFSLFLTLLLLSSTASAVAQADSDAAATPEYPQLGVNSLEPLSYEYDVMVDENCDYHFTVEFSHNEDFPVGNGDTCVPGVNADFDGLPMLAGRYFWESYPSYVKEATDMDHLSLDYNPCGRKYYRIQRLHHSSIRPMPARLLIVTTHHRIGRPDLLFIATADPTGGFLSPHYDFHFYRVSPQYRAEEMTCEVIPGTPACNPVQTTASGKAFFALEETVPSSVEASQTADETNTTSQLVNMPPGFAYNVADAVINMGMHSFDPSAVPLSPEDWTDPSLVFVTHNSTVVCFEPMLPFHFAVGDEDHFYEEPTIQYVEKSIPTLPYQYDVSFDAATKVTTVNFFGKSNVCQADFNAAKSEYEASMMATEGDSNTQQAEDGASAFFGTATMAATFVLGYLASLMA